MRGRDITPRYLSCGARRNAIPNGDEDCDEWQPGAAASGRVVDLEALFGSTETLRETLRRIAGGSRSRTSRLPAAITISRTWRATSTASPKRHRRRGVSTPATSRPCSSGAEISSA